MRLPSRSRCTSLPSLTARRPKVDSAISAWRQYSEIWLRIWSFFIALMGQAGGQRRAAQLSYHHLPTFGNAWLVVACQTRPSQTREIPELDHDPSQKRPN